MSFIRLNITAEGQTEERFIKDTLAVYLGAYNISTDVRRVLTSKDKRKSYRGGLLSYAKASKDIKTWLREDNNQEARFTTMFDLYALPDDFPRYAEAQRIKDPYKKVAFLEAAMSDEVQDRRFIPYIQLHEFEALVLSNPRNLEYEFLEHDAAIEGLLNLLAAFDHNPELINEGKDTAPSKRILDLIPEYDKVSVGPAIVGIEGVEALKAACSHFNSWIEKLVSLADAP